MSRHIRKDKLLYAVSVAVISTCSAPVYAAGMNGRADASVAGVSDAAQAPAPAGVRDAAVPEDQGFDTITVTAQRKAENIQSVPVAVAVISQETISNYGAFDPVDLGRSAVGLFANSFNGDRSNIIYTIRGQAYTTGTLFPAVVPYFADIPLGKLLVGTFFDLDNVQVLRGPQGTLFGRVTDGGNVMLSPARPTNEQGGYLQVKAGNYGLKSVNGAFNLPLVDDKVMVRGAFENVKRRGFTHDLRHDVWLDGVNYVSGRLSLLVKPSEGFENYTVVNYTHGDETGGSQRIYFINPPAFLAITTGLVGAAGARAYLAQMQAALARQERIGPRAVYSDTNAFDRRTQLILTNQTKVDITDQLTAKAIFGYTFIKQQTANDYDGTDLPYLNTLNSFLPTPLGYQRQLSGELQLQGNGMLDGRLDWTLGAYADRQTTPGPAESLSQQLFFLYSAGVQRLRTTSTAFYGQASVELLDGLKLNGGIRHTHDTSQSDAATWSALATGPTDPIPHGQCLTARPPGVLASSRTCVRSEASFNVVTWMGGLEYQVSRNVFAYAKISKGYRPGGFNAYSPALPYGPERVISKEIGLKTDFDIAGHPLRVNIAGFYDDFSNIQRLITLADSSGSSTANVNTKSATVKGIEVETMFKPIDQLELGANWNHILAHYNLKDYAADYIAAACPADPRTMRPDPTKFCPLSPFGRTPRDTLTLKANLTLPLSGESTVSLGADWYYTASQYVVTTGYVTPEVHIPSYNVLNMNLTFSNLWDSQLDLSFFGTNILNKTYLSTVSSVSQMGSLGFAGASYGAPAMYGASVRFKF
jgi:iron complex outermembrane receptor protein